MFQTVVSLVCAAFALVFVWKVSNFLWFKPKKLEKFFRQQGLNGNSYRLLVGDLREMDLRAKEAISKPIDFTSDFVPRIMPVIHKTVINCGPNCFIWLGPFPSLVISSTDHIREILSKSYVYRRPYNPLANILVEGLVSYDTDKWAKHRRIIIPAFQLEKIKNMVPSFHLSCCDMFSKWEEIEPNEDGSIELDVWPCLQNLTRDVISRTSFGSSFEEGTKIAELQTELIYLLPKAILSAFVPGWRFLPTKTNRRVKKIRKDVEILVLGIIDKRMKALEDGEASSNNLLDILLESNLKEIQQNGNKFGMSLHDVIEECKLFYLGGQETSSSLLVWTMILLSKHVDWQARAREEVLQICGSGAPDFQQLNNLKIVTMILHEVLRLYPPGPLLSRTIPKDTELGNLILPAGVQLLLPAILVHHDPSIWGSDANEFNPYRFSEGVSKATQGSLTYFPFGWGPRICIGQNFAMFEAKMALAMILRHYSFELSPSYSHAPRTITTLQPQHGAHLILSKL